MLNKLNWPFSPIPFHGALALQIILIDQQSALQSTYHYVYSYQISPNQC